MFDVLPDVSEAPGDQRVGELRTRVYAERTDDFGEHLRINLAGYVDGLVAERSVAGASRRVDDATVRPGDLYAEYRTERFDVRAGFSRIVWGRLDEFQPTDVVNPIDLARFMLEGRSEARLPVALVRGRVFLPGSSAIEAVLVPVFRASRFDQLDEETSPFNLAPVGFPFVDEPATRWGHSQGGARFTTTTGRVDWGLSAYRGFRTFALPTYPRFTMVGGDFETVRGEWGLRGEGAWFSGESDELEAGVGVDRRAGDYRIAGNILVTDRPIEGTDVLLVAAADRTFARETRRLRVFGVYDPTDRTGFTRVTAAISLRDDVWLEGSGGLFAGSSLDTLGRLTQRDFAYVRLKVFY